jgi:hypothetical protein
VSAPLRVVGIASFTEHLRQVIRMSEICGVPTPPLPTTLYSHFYRVEAAD